MIMKLADLGHLAAPLPIHLRWVSLLEEELFRQGDLELERGLAVSQFADRCRLGISTSQIGFFETVGLPTFEAFTAVFPEVDSFTSQVRSNYKHWSGLDTDRN